MFHRRMVRVIKDLTAAIIAGGKSRRFGEPKASALFRNRKLLDYSIDVAQKISAHVIIIDGVNESIGTSKYPIFKDLIPGCGPLGGIYTALKFSCTPFVATLPCDTPFLIPELYEILFNQVTWQQPVVAESESGLEPLIAIWPKTMIVTLEQAILANNYSLSYSLELSTAKKIYIPAELSGYHPNMFFNINDKKDLEKLTKLEVSFPGLAS